jgi:hypothetical protein
MIGEKISARMVSRPSRQMVFITLMTSTLRLEEVLPTTENEGTIRGDCGAGPSDILQLGIVTSKCRCETKFSHGGILPFAKETQRWASAARTNCRQR